MVGGDEAVVGMSRPIGTADRRWVVTNAEHVVALVVWVGLLFRRTVQRRHFGRPSDNDGGAGREYIEGLVGRSFWWCLLACWVADIAARGTIIVVLRLRGGTMWCKWLVM